MGYTTEFQGTLELDRKLDDETHTELDQLNQRRHGGDIDHDGFPSFYCQWVPTEDGKAIMWDGGEKFYGYIEWLQHIIDKYLKPKDYVLNGKLLYSGEEIGDTGSITVENNVITRREVTL